MEFALLRVGNLQEDKSLFAEKAERWYNIPAPGTC
jgi:hypothetical protein